MLKKTLTFLILLLAFWLAINYFTYFFGFYSSLAIVSGAYEDTGFFVPEEIKFYDSGKVIGSLYYDREQDKVITKGVLPQKPINVYYEYKPFNRFLYEQVTFNYTESDRQKEIFIIMEQEYVRRNYSARRETEHQKMDVKVVADEIIIEDDLFSEPLRRVVKQKAVQQSGSDFKNVRVVSLGEKRDTHYLDEKSSVGDKRSGRVIRSEYREDEPSQRVVAARDQRPVSRVIESNGESQDSTAGLERTVFLRYHNNGERYLEAEMLGSLPDGFTRIYYENGNLKALIVFKQGKKDGLCKTYYSSGNIENEIHCQNDVIIHKKTYDEAGRLIISW